MSVTAPAAGLSATIEVELASLLNELLARQSELMALLARKQTLLGNSDCDGLHAIAGEEERLLGLLQESLDRREQLLSRAGAEGMPSSSIEALTKSLPPAQRTPSRSSLPRPVRALGFCRPKV